MRGLDVPALPIYLAARHIEGSALGDTYLSLGLQIDRTGIATMSSI
jgi:hydroxylamine reductase (hybrid-cluster protein)